MEPDYNALCESHCTEEELCDPNLCDADLFDEGVAVEEDEYTDDAITSFADLLAANMEEGDACG
jgi:hypothetical protein